MALLLGARALLGAKGVATRSKDATRGSWPYYWEQERYLEQRASLLYRSKDASSMFQRTWQPACHTCLSLFVSDCPAPAAVYCDGLSAAETNAELRRTFLEHAQRSAKHQGLTVSLVNLEAHQAMRALVAVKRVVDYAVKAREDFHH